MPSQSGVAMLNSSFMVFGSRKSSRLKASATTMACLPSGVQYMLYGSSTGMVLPGLPVFGSITVRLPLSLSLGVVGHVQRLQVPARHHVLRVQADLEGVDHLQRGRVDDRHRVRHVVGHVDALQRAGHVRAQLAGRRLAVQVLRVGHRHHAGHGGPAAAAGAGRGSAGRSGASAPAAGGRGRAACGLRARVVAARSGCLNMSIQTVAAVEAGAAVALRIAATLCCTIRSVPSWPSSALARGAGPPCTPAAPARHFLRPHARAVQRQHQRSVGGAGMAADLRVAQAALAQRLWKGACAAVVVVGDEVRARRAAFPVAVQRAATAFSAAW